MLKGMKTMIEGLKCCIYILFAKQYALYTAYTADKYKFGRFGSCYIRAANKAFLEAIIDYTYKVSNQIKEGEK